MRKLAYDLVDVFSSVPFRGNGLTVFHCETTLAAGQMLSIAREMRQMESIFLFGGCRNGEGRARLFTVEEELDFAGHPLLGAAATLHRRFHPKKLQCSWQFQLNRRKVKVGTERIGDGIRAAMIQGQVHFGSPLAKKKIGEFLTMLGISPADLLRNLPVQVVSTGLPYLMVPVRAVARMKIRGEGLTAALARVGAKFTYVIEPERAEGRSWDNFGQIEDVATGSAAGPAAAYLVRHGVRPSGRLILHQGRFTGRPSRMEVHIAGDPPDALTADVRGPVASVGEGWIWLK